ncbi:MAG: hypothetical protein WEB60_09680 [Terrimicrobiaceae bacterium]
MQAIANSVGVALITMFDIFGDSLFGFYQKREEKSRAGSRLLFSERNDFSIVRLLKPRFRCAPEKLLEGDASRPDQKILGAWLAGTKRGKPGGFSTASGFDFDCAGRVSPRHHKIDFVPAVSPIGNSIPIWWQAIEQMGSNGIFNQSSPPSGILSGLCEVTSAKGFDECRDTRPNISIDPDSTRKPPCILRATSACSDGEKDGYCTLAVKSFYSIIE